ncbi:TonB-dependent receptor [Sphingomonas sp. TREG-RG-20F-R18-01]|uniref:TonB-dependent receptor n=1 Tax=Sphingomonas sp. TREG-RG-20F-R18-01 TaxID=2914982 RepID=UPI001F5919EB|nr:TonB-dependent receptor [Sphingomonas sp. TREG-RG-20F-R18-01]
MSRLVAAKPAYLALSCVGAFASLPAFANDAPPPPPPANDEDPDHKLDIVVHGQREPRRDPKLVAPLVDTPKSIVVLDKSVIQQTGSTSLQDALRTVPGITFGAAEGGNPIGDRPFIRGFDSQGSVYVDGVRDLSSQTREVFAVDSIQIVRGSDSTLGGRGNAGGSLNILSRLPQLRTFGTASASYGNGDFKRVTGDVNVQLGDTAAFRLQGVWHDQKFADRDSIYAKRWGFAPSVTLGLGTPTRLTASYYYLESHELPDSGIPYQYVCSATTCALPAGNVFTTPAIGTITTRGGQTGTVKRSAFYGLEDRDFRDATTNQAMLRVEHDFGGITLRNTARYAHSDQAYIFTLPDDSQGNVFGTATTNPTGAAGARGDVLTGGYVWRRGNTRYSYTESLIDQTDLSGTVSTGGIKHSFAVGTELAWEKTRRGIFVSANGSTISPRCNSATIARYYCASLFAPNPSDPWVNYASDTSSVATAIVRGAANTETQNDATTVSVYGFDSVTLLPQLILNLGARYDRFKSTVTLPFAAGSTATRLSRTDTLFNWQAGLVFKPTSETSLYASYATAATPPNALLGEGREDNALPTTNSAANLAILDSLKVQKTKSYEVGAKGSLFHEKLQLGLAVFQTDITNARVQIDANTVGFLGRTRIRGVELTASGTILPGWTVFGGYTYLDPKMVDGGNSALTVAANGPAPAQTVYVPSVNTGRQVPQTAKQSFTATTNYELLKGLQIGGSAIYMGRQYGGYADNRAATQTSAGVVTITPATTILSRGIPDYWRFDARASYAITPNVEISVNAQNLTNTVYFTQTFTAHYAAIAPGRTVFGTVTAKF